MYPTHGAHEHYTESSISEVGLDFGSSERSKMKISYDLDLERFEAWSGAVDTLNTIIDEGKCDALEWLLEDLYPDGMDETQLNDLLWFESDWLFESLGIETDEAREERERQEREEELEDAYVNWCNGQDCDTCKYRVFDDCLEKFEEERPDLNGDDEDA